MNILVHEKRTINTRNFIESIELNACPQAQVTWSLWLIGGFAEAPGPSDCDNSPGVDRRKLDHCSVSPPPDRWLLISDSGLNLGRVSRRAPRDSAPRLHNFQLLK